MKNKYLNRLDPSRFLLVFLLSFVPEEGAGTSEGCGGEENDGKEKGKGNHPFLLPGIPFATLFFSFSLFPVKRLGASQSLN